MNGNTLTRSAHALFHLARRPELARQWFEDLRTGCSPIERRLPWFSYQAIETLESWLRPGMSVFEWGSGGSTLFFAQKGCRVTTVESNAGWAKRVRESLASHGLSAGVVIREVPAETKDPQRVQDYIHSLGEGGCWDVIVVDGLEEEYVSRMDCLRYIAANPHRVSRSGCVILDDAWRAEYCDAARLLAGFRQQACWGLGPCRMGVTRTDIFWGDGASA